MDTSIWSTWNDLDPTDEVELVLWFHGTYLSALRKRTCPPAATKSKGRLEGGQWR
jgi:hypothetical protein